MGIFNKLRQEAKIDSRRFGKSIVCRIVYGFLLSYLYQKGIVPSGIFINYDTGLDPVNNKMIVIPVTAYDRVIDFYQNYDRDLQEIKNDIDALYKAREIEEALLDVIKQNIVLVSVSPASIPEGLKSGTLPEAYDVLIDSIDVNQSIEATYVYRNRSSIRETDLKWNNKVSK